MVNLNLFLCSFSIICVRLIAEIRETLLENKFRFVVSLYSSVHHDKMQMCTCTSTCKMHVQNKIVIAIDYPKLPIAVC